MEEFAKWRIYKEDIVEYLRETKDARNITELSEEECDKIIENIAPHRDYYWTEWYWLYSKNLYHLPLFEGTPPILGGES